LYQVQLPTSLFIFKVSRALTNGTAPHRVLHIFGPPPAPFTCSILLRPLQNLQARGFWLSGGDKTGASRAKQARALARVVGLIQQHKYQAEAAELPFREFGAALNAESKQKQLLVFQ